MSNQQQTQLLEVLTKHKSLFDGTLSCYPKRKFKIELKPGTVPYHCERPYPVPQSVWPVLKEELQRQCDLNILAKCYETEWGMPLLVVPKKDGAIQTVDDFRDLNKHVIRSIKQYRRSRNRAILEVGVE